jgi:hypothetical protein
MSINVPPPEFNFTGLIYNPEWWISTSVASGALTQSVANTLYLRKTTTDSASALETFNAGIKASDYDTITAGATQNMFSTQTANTNLFGNMGAGQTLKLGNQTTSQSVHCSKIDCNGTTINNATAPANGDLSIGSLQTGTAGILNLGTNGSRTGDIFIGGGTCSIKINRPLAPQYASAPGTGSIGNQTSPAITSITTTIGTTATNLASFTLPIGTWSVEASIVITPPTANTFIRFGLSTNITATIDTSRVMSMDTNATSSAIFRINAIYQGTGALLYMVSQATTTTATAGTYNVVITRIA